MARPRKSKIIAEAEALIAALRPLESKLDIGKNLTLQAYIAKTDATRGFLANVNTLIAQLETARNVFSTSEDELGDMSRRMRKGVLVQFGSDSSEFESVGGVRTSDRKRRSRRPDDPNPAPSNDPAAPTA
jgi:hypothetical protein